MGLMDRVGQKEWGCRGGEYDKSALYKKDIVTPSTFNKYTPRKDDDLLCFSLLNCEVDQ